MMQEKQGKQLKEVDVVMPKAHLIGICQSFEEEAKLKSMQELELLVETMGLVTVSKHLQKRDKPDKTYYTGKGFMEEVKAQMEDGDVLIFDNDLMPSQIRNIIKKFEIDVLDRTEVILEIFLKHAKSKEAKIQVNLARYEYELPRLRNLWQHLDRERGTASTGGISRGAGEKQIELDKRIVRMKITKAKQDLKKIAEQKEVQRQYRLEQYKKVCIVGYTNAGKSTLFNALTGKNVLVEDKLFATLVSTSRAIELAKGKKIILSDTVGFISHLPHHLVASFRATLQEVRDADLLLHITDASAPEYKEHLKDVDTVLKEIGSDDIPQLIVFNKTDAISHAHDLNDLKNQYSEGIFISALKKENLDFLLDIVDKKLNAAHEHSLLIPHAEQKVLSSLFELGEVLSKEYHEDGVLIKVLLNDEDLYRFENWKK
jgi:GTPase